MNERCILCKLFWVTVGRDGTAIAVAATHRPRRTGVPFALRLPVLTRATSPLQFDMSFLLESTPFYGFSNCIALQCSGASFSCWKSVAGAKPGLNTFGDQQRC